MKELFLSTRWNRLMSLASSMIIMSACALAFIFMMYLSPAPQTSQVTPRYGDFRADLFLLFIGFFVGLISSIVLSLSKSDEEKDKMEKSYAGEATRELIRMMDKLEKYIDNRTEDFLAAYSIFLSLLKEGYANIAQEDISKMFLKGLSNTLIFVYISYQGYLETRNDLIRHKPENWEQLVDNIDEIIDNLVEIKGCLHSTYERIEKIAIRHGIPITTSKDPKFRYLVYAEADMLKLLDASKKGK